MSQTRWHASVLYATADLPLTDEQADALVANLPGYASAVHAGDRIRLEMTVEASTLRKATDEAVKAANAAFAAAFDTVGTPVGVRVLTLDDYQRELSHPAPLDLVGLAEVTEMGGFNSRQAADAATKNADFPAPVATPRMGKVWARSAVEAFLDRWPRTKGWAGHKAAASNG